MNELLKILTAVKSETVNIHLSERQISFQIEESLVVSRLINGIFLITNKLFQKTHCLNIEFLNNF